MNVVLTESQVREIMKHTYWEDNMQMLEESSFETIKNWLKRAILAGAAIFSLYTAIDNLQNLTDLQKDYLKELVRNESDKQNSETYDQASEELHELKVQELERCMHDKFRRLKGHQAYNPDEIKLSAEELVSACEEYDYDLVLAAAQAWIESVWGTTPRALKTKSVFSVGSYDNSKNTANYDTVNASIRPYIELMQKSYGINPEKIDSIFNGNQKLVNDIGNRYASDKNYENRLKITYNSIKKNYPILSMSLDEYINNEYGTENS